MVGPRDDGQVRLDRSVVNDPRLSFRAIGVALFLASKPDATVAEIVAASDGEGRDAVRTALRELEACGYYTPRTGRCPVCTGVVPLQPQGQTYLVRRQGWVKIGSSRHIERRLRALARETPGVLCPDGMDPAAPLTLLATLPTNVEHDLHERFAASHVAGEWFTAEPHVSTWLAEGVTA